MAEVASAPASNEQVPLDSIPISPDGAMTDATNGATHGNSAADTDKIVTVFDDPANFNVKHQLQHTWTLWFTKPPTGKQDWNELLKEVISFNSVEEFWGIYVSLAPSSAAMRCRAPANSSFHTEQHHTCLGARPEIRLPPVQTGRAP